MENFESAPYEQAVADDNLKITGAAEMNLEGAAKWAKIVSIITLSCMGLVLLLMFVMSFLMPGAAGFFAVILYTIILGIAALPYYFMYKFSTQVQAALHSKDGNYLTDGLGSLKNTFLIMAIFMMIAIAIYLIAFLIIIASGASMLGTLGGF